MDTAFSYIYCPPWQRFPFLQINLFMCRARQTLCLHTCICNWQILKNWYRFWLVATCVLPKGLNAVSQLSQSPVWNITREAGPKHLFKHSAVWTCSSWFRRLSGEPTAFESCRGCAGCCCIFTQDLMLLHQCLQSSVHQHTSFISSSLVYYSHSIAHYIKMDLKLVLENRSVSFFRFVSIVSCLQSCRVSECKKTCQEQVCTELNGWP